jgi:hypothetical protein
VLPDELDRARVERLAAEIMRAIRPELARFPPSRENVFTALNPLAFAAAAVLAGTDRNGRRFFEKAIADNIKEVRAAEARGDLRPPGHIGHA